MDNETARPPLTQNLILALKEVNYWMRQIGANAVTISFLGTLTVWTGQTKHTYTSVYQDMEMERIKQGWPPLHAQEGGVRC